MADIVTKISKSFKRSLRMPNISVAHNVSRCLVFLA